MLKPFLNRSTALGAASALAAGLLLSCSGKADAQAPSVDPAEQQRIFWSSPEENLKPTRWDSGDTTISNEARLELFRPHAQNLRGGHVGVGSTQNFVLAAWAKADWIWMMDFTRIVVAANKIHVAFLKEAATPAEFQKLWQRRNQKRALEIITAAYGKDADFAFIKKAYRQARFYQSKRFRFMNKITKRRGYSIWLNDQAQYDHIRDLAKRGRIRALRGDMNGSVTLTGIGAAATKMGVPIRIFYPSNAEEYTVFWPYRKQFRANIRSLPADDKSLVLRTISVKRHRLPWAQGWEGVSRVGFHYNKQPLKVFQKWLAADKNVTVYDMLKAGQIEGRSGFSVAAQDP